MKRFLIPLLLLAAPAFGAEPGQFCSSIQAYVETTDVCGASDNLDCCPPDLSSASSGDALTDVSMNAQVITTVTTDTVYACIFPTSITYPTGPEIIAGTGCTSTDTDTGNLTATFAFTDLIASTEYAVGFVHDWDAGRQNQAEVIYSAPVTTLAGSAPGGGDLTNTGYFVDSVSGDDNNDGLSDTNAWATIAKVNNNVTAAGSNVYLKAGSVFEDETLNVDWNGTSSDRVIVQTYCMDGATPRAWTDGGTGCSTKAEINGTLDATCRSDPATCNVAGMGGTVPSGAYSGLVQVDSDYVTIDSLIIADSAADGIIGDGDLGGVDNTLPGLHLTNNEIRDIAFVPVQINDRARNFYIADNLIHDVTYCEKWQFDGYGKPVRNCDSGGQPGGLSVVRGEDAYGLIENNIIYNCKCELINIGRNSHIWVRGNKVANGGIGIYMTHGANNIVEDNLVIGNPGSGFAPNATQQGIGLGMEVNAVGLYYAGAENNIIRNNIVINGDQGIHLNNVSAEAASAGLKIGGYFYGNTLISQEIYGININSGGVVAAYEDIEIRNNIVYQPQLTVDSICRETASGAVDTWSHNYWSLNPSDSDCDGTGDVIGDPGLPNTDSWYENLNYTYFASYDIEDFRGSNVDDGILPTLPAWATTLLNDTGWDDVTSAGHDTCDGTLNADLVNDYLCVDRDASPAIGALESTP